MENVSFRQFTPSGKIVKEFPMVNLTLRTGYLSLGRNVDEITAGAYMQAGAEFDQIVDPDVS